MSRERPYTKITRFGSSFVTDEPGIVVDEIVDHVMHEPDEPPIEMTIVWMTDQEYESLAEFEGW